MAKKVYKPYGNDKLGYRLRVPSYVEIASGYTCQVKEDGVLIYTPSEVQG